MEDKISNLNEVTPEIDYEEFVRVMDIIREKDPKTWAKLYCEAVRIANQHEASRILNS